MEKTTNYQLNKPEATDPMRVSDFNENAEIIDAALGLLSVERIVMGSYEGNDKKDRIINLPFTPRLVIQLGHINSGGGITVTTPDIAYAISSGSCGSTINTCIVENGFKTAIAYTLWHNTSGKTEYYVAVR